jgi:hypothetical protein
VLVWAQQQAAAAAAQWQAGNKQNAQAILDNARSQAAAAAGTAAGIIGRARDQAPASPGFWSEVGGFLASAWHGAEEVGGYAINGAASLGNAIISNPGADALGLGGALLAGVSAIGDAVGGALDLTVVGAALGAPLNAVSTIGLAAGSGMVLASAGDLAGHAAGDDRASPVHTGGGSGPAPEDPRLIPGNPEYDAYINELAEDPAHVGVVNAKTRQEAAVAVRAEADGDLPGPLTRTPFRNNMDDGDFTDGTGQKWEVKSSPDLQPS